MLQLRLLLFFHNRHSFRNIRSPWLQTWVALAYIAVFVYDLYSYQSTGFSAAENQMIKDINLNWSREALLIIHVVVWRFFSLFQIT